MLILVLLFGSFPLVHCLCPSGYEIVTNGECRGKEETGIKLDYGTASDEAVAKCQEVQGLPVIIHDDEHQSYYLSKYNYFMILGLTCNTRSKRWEWVDGSTVDYKPSAYSAGLDRDCNTGYVWYLDRDGRWYSFDGYGSTSFDIWCTTKANKPDRQDCDNFEHDSEDSACYQIITTPENWQDAQTACRNLGANLASIHNLQENSFVRRLAVSRGTVNGVFIGATLSGNGTDYGWVDRTEWDYNNLYPGFPIDGLGDCLTMDTFGSSGQWMNIDCKSKLPVACVRQQKASNADICSSGPWTEHQSIYTPGFPYDASVPCDYFLTVPAGKRVEVTVLVLEANSCCDQLVLADNYINGNFVANLTSQVIGEKFTTKSSNFMRVSWNPVGGVNVRGAMFSYRAV